MLLGIADAMRYLHEHGVIHRNLKPENILIDTKNYPQVSNYGLSKCISSSLTKTSNCTPLYMAPELLRGEDVYIPEVDVYSFSILAYEIITCQTPYSELLIIIKNQQTLDIHTLFSTSVIFIITV